MSPITNSEVLFCRDRNDGVGNYRLVVSMSCQNEEVQANLFKTMDYEVDCENVKKEIVSDKMFDLGHYRIFISFNSRNLDRHNDSFIKEIDQYVPLSDSQSWQKISEQLEDILAIRNWINNKAPHEIQISGKKEIHYGSAGDRRDGMYSFNISKQEVCWHDTPESFRPTSLNPNIEERDCANKWSLMEIKNQL